MIVEAVVEAVMQGGLPDAIMILMMKQMLDPDTMVQAVEAMQQEDMKISFRII